MTSLAQLQSYLESHTSRRLADTYRSSLIYTNLQLIRMFGVNDRFVPAHMPHLINKHVMEIIEKNMTSLYNQTIHHRFRENNDLQYAFLYFHYLYHLEYMKKENRSRELFDQLDTNHDGVLNTNELISLATMVYSEQYTIKYYLVLLTE